MSFYNLLFGMNQETDVLLAVIGLKRVDVERLRDTYRSPDGKFIFVYTRTGGGNRESYPNLVMRKRPEWRGSVDDEFDSTYCTDTFEVPEQWREDVKNLGDITKGLRAEFGQHIAATLNREPTDRDKAQAAYDAEARELARTKHFLANGHTFVPLDDYAMETALEFAEKNGGRLLSCWGIMPIALTVKRDYHPSPNAEDPYYAARLVRVEVGYDFRWTIDEQYWSHCQKRFTDKYPRAMAAIAEDIAKRRGQS